MGFTPREGSTPSSGTKSLTNSRYDGVGLGCDARQIWRTLADLSLIIGGSPSTSIGLRMWTPGTVWIGTNRVRIRRLMTGPSRALVSCLTAGSRSRLSGMLPGVLPGLTGSPGRSGWGRAASHQEAA